MVVRYTRYGNLQSNYQWKLLFILPFPGTPTKTRRPVHDKDLYSYTSDTFK